MRKAVIIGGAVAVGCLAILGVVQAQYSVTGSLWPTAKTTVQPAATSTPAPAPTNAQPGAPRVATVVASPPATQPPAATGPAPWQQRLRPRAQAGPAAAPSASAPAPRATQFPCNNPNALGVSRVVEIDPTGGPGFGTEHFKNHDFLQDHEVVLTFDDGPWLNNTPMVLKALADECVRATFFSIGKHSTYYPDILKQVAAAGHTIGSHTWSHKDLAKLAKKNVEDAKTEIEMGASAVAMSLGAPIAPFFRFPDLRHPPELVTYLGQRNVAIFSTDLDSFDFKIHKPEQVIQSVMTKLAKHGKGIILMHDFQSSTAHAMPQLLAELKAGGYKIVHMTAKGTLQTLPQYDAMLLKDQKLPTVDQRPTSSVVHTVQ